MRATVTVAVSDTFTHWLSGTHCRKPTFAARSAEAAHSEVIAVSPKTTVSQNWCICSTSDRSKYFRHTHRFHRTFQPYP